MINYLSRCAVLLLTLWAIPLHADFQTGMDFLNNGSYEEAFVQFQKAAEQGDPRAQYYAGHLLDNGQGTSRDPDEALSWFKKSAEAGYPDAQCALGYRYEKGIGFPKNYRLAIEWYRKAGEQGNGPALRNMGQLYEYGRGVEQNKEKALEWYKLAAAQGEPESIRIVNKMTGQGSSSTKTPPPSNNAFKNRLNAIKNKGSAVPDGGMSDVAVPPGTPQTGGGFKPSQPVSGPIAAEWDIVSELDDSIYPSAIIATSMMKPNAKPEPNKLGDPVGHCGIWIKAPKENTRVKVEISSGKIIEKSVFEGTLKTRGGMYKIFPVLRYDYDTLLEVRQPFPEVVTAQVTLDERDAGEKSKRISVRSINDCLLGVREDGRYINTPWAFAAYVNENHPAIDQVLKEALDSKFISEFKGYQGDPQSVMGEMEAVWKVLQQRGFRYSSITRSSGESKVVNSQHVRLLGDSLRATQANCVDGSVLIASILRKLDMDPVLVLIPGHMFMGLSLDRSRDWDKAAYLETTALGEKSFEDAVKIGQKTYAKFKNDFKDDSKPDCQLIDIQVMRKMGVMPIREPGADLPVSVSEK